METISVTPHWPGMRTWLLETVLPFDLVQGVRIGVALGCQAPTMAEMADAANVTEETIIAAVEIELTAQHHES